jgi:hypothetical protein
VDVRCVVERSGHPRRDRLLSIDRSASFAYNASAPPHILCRQDDRT